jgi:hypothetical protein
MDAPAQRRRRVRAGERGSGLVEVLVAVAITGTAVVWLLAAISTGSLGVSTTDEQVTAEHLARSQLEDTKSQPFDALPATYPTLTPIPGYGIAVDAAAIPEGDSAIQLITVTVTKAADTLAVLEGYKVDR